MDSLAWTITGDGTLLVSISAEIYSTEVVQKAVHSFGSECDHRVDKRGNEIWIELFPKSKDIDWTKIGRALFTRISDYALRERLDKETAACRNLIMAHALRRSGLSEEDKSSD